MLSYMNHFLRETEQIYLDSELGLDFSNGSVGSLLTSFFAEQGFIEMLKASNYETIN